MLFSQYRQYVLDTFIEGSDKSVEQLDKMNSHFQYVIETMGGASSWNGELSPREVRNFYNSYLINYL